MVRWVAVAALCFSMGSAAAQTVMDGSDKNLAPGRLGKLQGVMRSSLRDPFAAQILGLYEAKDGWICGKVNNKNGRGAYVGFVFFVSRPEREFFTMADPLESLETLSLLEAHKQMLTQMQKICTKQSQG